MHIDHVNIKATAGLIEKLREFYHQVLGLDTGPRPAFRDRGYWLYSGDTAIIHLSESPRDPDIEPGGAFDHFAIRVRDLVPVIQRLQETGLEYHESLVPGTGLRQVFFKDPAGTKVEVQGPVAKP
ncbi:MAG: VOC family protein [Xanthomonadales bacterium]|nr:VOC family protein [Xanthomonadales bacterium]